MRRAGRDLGTGALLAVLSIPLSTIASGPTVVAAASPPVADVEAVCAPAAPGYAQCLALRRTDVMAQSALTMSPLTVSPPFGPADIQSAYALPGGSAGSGLTVAVVDAFDLPTAEADLAAYRSQFGLPSCTTANGCFRKVNQNGVQGSYPAVDPGWGQEIALDIDMVSAACPNCKILLVEANSASMADLGTSVNTAVSLGAVAVSNSYGGRESSSASLLDTAYYNHPGVAIVASTGDCGWNCSPKTSTTYYANVQYPASSPYVVAVGGTSLVSDGSARGWTESAWSGAGSGCSAYESKPSWQHDAGCAKRTQADVSAVADPNTGVFVYYNGNWYEFGGTSASSPIIASIFALAGGPAAGTYPASYLYAAATGLNDVIGGNNDSTWGNCPAGSYLCNAVAGYDGPTGLGTPNGVGAFAWRQVPGKPADVVAARGNASASVSWTAAAANGSTVTAYTVTASDGIHTCGWTSGALSCTVGGLTNGTPYTFTVTATNGVGTGPASLPSNSVTPATVPGPPTAVTATLGNRSALASWLAPADNGGIAITAYTVTASDGIHTCGWTTGALSCTVGGLTNGTPYTFTVTATNGVGAGPASGVSNAVTPAAVPDKPTNVVATRGDTSASVAWTAPADNGSIITGYTVTSSPDGQACGWTVGQLSCTVTGLANGTAYTFTVTARNIIGMGLPSDISNSVTPAGAPGAPAGVQATGADSAAIVSWTAPASNGSPIAGYTATAWPGGRSCTTTGGLTCAITGLTNRTTYSVTVTSSNGVGTGPASSPATPVTPFSGATYVALTPARVLDTRSGAGLAGPFSSHAARTFQVAGRGGVPGNATAVTGNLTVTGQTSSGYLFLGPVATNDPTSSTLNFPVGDDRANGVTVALGGGGTLSVTFVAPNPGPSAHAIFDVTGYFVPDISGATYVALTPARVLDTRSGAGLAGPFSSHAARTFQVAGRGGVPGNATAVTGNLTVTGQTSSGYLFLGPVATNDPTSSTLNFPLGDDRANGVTVALGGGGTLSVTFVAPNPGPSAHAIFDVTGYFVP